MLRRLLPAPADAVSVHRAASQVEALAVEQALRGAGFWAWTRSRQVPGYADVIAASTGVWGEVLVAPEDLEAARAVLGPYLASVRLQGGEATAADVSDAEFADAVAGSEEDRAVRRFAGIIPPLVTLFDESGRIDEPAMRRHVDRVIEAGVHGVLALGSTGEVMHLLPDERRRVAELVIEQVAGRVPVIVGCGSTSTDEAINFARHAQEAGAAAAIVIVPFYWTLSDRAVEAHFAAVARAVDLPVLIYNFPAVSGRNIPPDLVARLAGEHANMAGIKETIDNIGHIQQVLARVRPARPDFTVLCGFEYHLLNTLLLGGDGAIPGMANLAPVLSVEAYDAYARGEVEAVAASLRRRMDFPALYQFEAPLFVVVKEAMCLAGLIAHPTVRLPAQPLSEDSRARLRGLLAELGLL